VLPVEDSAGTRPTVLARSTSLRLRVPLNGCSFLSAVSCEPLGVRCSLELAQNLSVAHINFKYPREMRQRVGLPYLGIRPMQFLTIFIDPREANHPTSHRLISGFGGTSGRMSNAPQFARLERINSLTIFRRCNMQDKTNKSIN